MPWGIYLTKPMKRYISAV